MFKSASHRFLVFISLIALMGCSDNAFQSNTGNVQKALDVVTGGTSFQCVDGTTSPCEIGGKPGKMKCVNTGEGSSYDQCVLDGDGTTGTPLGNCVFKGVTYLHGQSFTAYYQAVVPSNGSCTSEVRTCINGALTGSFQNLTCTKQNGDCSVAGQTVPNGGSIDMYETASVPYGQTCKKQTRVCSNSTLSGTYTFLTCVPDPAMNCTLGNQTIPNGSAITAYEAAEVRYGSACVSQQRSCSNGVLGGTYQYLTCVVQGAHDCYFNNKIVKEGEKVKAYYYWTVPYGKSCDYYSEELTCHKGCIGGSGYAKYATCTVRDPAPCSFNGQTIPHGGTVKAYRYAHVNAPGTCSYEERRCNNGVLSGNCGYPSCTVRYYAANGTIQSTEASEGRMIASVIETAPASSGGGANRGPASAGEADAEAVADFWSVIKSFFKGAL